MKRRLEQIKRWLSARTLGQKTLFVFGLVIFCWILIGVGIALIPTNNALILLGFLGVFAAVALDVFWCRCPHCGRHLRWTILGVDYCPGCGKKL